MTKRCYFLILLAFPPLTFAGTPVSGEQSGVWTAADSPYWVVGEIVVPSGKALSIEPAVEVIFQGHFKFIVNGALRAEGNTSDHISFTTDNPAAGWGGIRFIDADAGSVLSYCEIEFGRATGTWPENSGGGVSLWDSDVAIRHCGFNANHADYLGGALFCWGSDPEVSYSAFRDNDCGYDGGAIRLYFSNASLNECEVTHNMASYYGAALSIETGDVVINSCLLANNNAYAEGGAIWANLATVTMTKCTVSENTTVWGWGGALYLAYTRAAIDGCILWNNYSNGGEIYLDVEASADVDYSDIQGNWSGVGNIDVDPLFADPSGGDFRITGPSPCIDAGDPADDSGCEKDLWHDPRVLDGDLDRERRTDMGAHEFDNVHLEISGQTTPGGTLTFETTGTAGLPVYMLVATAPGVTCHPLFGCLFVDFSSPLWLYPWASIPSSIPVEIPPDAPAPFSLTFQELALSGTAGNTSNPVEAVIE